MKILENKINVLTNNILVIKNYFVSTFRSYFVSTYRGKFANITFYP